tara:strand:+ start:200 stop:805 length:606 start_codon:yes stop_codon:yes gene_type:complete
MSVVEDNGMRSLAMAFVSGVVATYVLGKFMLVSEKKKSSSEEEKETTFQGVPSMRQKLVLVVNGGLISGSKRKRVMKEGKMAAQCCHAAVSCCMKSREKLCYKVWSMSGGAKICLKTNPSKEWLQSKKGKETADAEDHLAYMYDIQQRAKKAGLTTYLVADAGHTQLVPGTITVLGIGPDDADKIDLITGRDGALPCKLVQ